MSYAAITFEQVYYRYIKNQDWVLKNIDLQIAAGSVWLLLGPTGSGKSTVLSLIRGFHKEWGGELSGSIRLNGQPTGDKTFYEIGDLGIGFVSQDPSLNLHQLTVRDEIQSTPIYRNFSWEKCNQLADEMMGRLNISDLADRTPTELSGGQMQKVAIAAALTVAGGEDSGSKGILLLDEPDSFLDFGGRKDLLETIGSLKGLFTTIVATHRPELYAELADGTSLLVEGQNRITGTTAEVLYSDAYEETVGNSWAIRLAKYFKETEYLSSSPLTPNRWVSELTDKIGTGPSPSRAKQGTISGDTVSYEDVRFSYPEGGQPLRGVCGHVPPGTLTAIVGNNGSGKTTLAKLTLNLLKGYEGSIRLLGNDIARYTHAELSKIMAYVPQIPREFFLANTVGEECELTAKIHGLSDAEQKIRRALETVGLWDYSDTPVDRLSGGQGRLLTLAATTLLVNQQITFADEPEFGVDYNNLDSVLEHFVRIRDNDGTIVMLTHDLDLTLFCDWVILLHEGKVTKMGHPQQVYENELDLENIGLCQPVLFPVFNLVWRDTARVSNFRALIDALQAKRR